MSRAVVHGGILYTSGQVDAKADDVAGQMRNILAAIDRILENAGTSRSRLISANIWLADISTFDEMNVVWDEWIDSAAPPARATNSRGMMNRSRGRKLPYVVLDGFTQTRLVNSVGTFVFARKQPESTTNFDVYARMFASQTGIVEDPATGGAIGPLAGYMLQHGLLPNKGQIRFVSEQGTKMRRQSFLYVRVTGDSAEPTIEVGGSAVTVAEATLYLDRH